METLHDIVNKYKPFGTPESILDYIRKVTPKWFSSPWEKMGAMVSYWFIITLADE